MLNSIKKYLRGGKISNHDANKISTEEDIEFIEGERSVPSVNKALSIQSKITNWTGFAVVIIFFALFLSQYYRTLLKDREQHKETAVVDKTRRSQLIIPPFASLQNEILIPPPPAPPPQATSTHASSEFHHQYTNRENPIQTPNERKLTTSVKFKIDRNNSALDTTHLQRTLSPSSEDALHNDTLSEGSKINYSSGVKASLIPDRNMFITRGSILDCTIEEAIHTAEQGLLSCYLSRDVYSASGSVVLLEKQTKLTGAYRADIRGKDARLFVIWSRAETPTGVIVDLESPVTDGLGRAGVDGVVDTHFLERFSSGMLISIIGDASEALINRRAVEGNNNYVSFPNTAKNVQSMAIEAIKQNSSIPNTLKKNQAAHVNVFVARDIDFRGVYSLEPARRY